MELFGFNVGGFVEKPQGNLSSNYSGVHSRLPSSFFLLCDGPVSILKSGIARTLTNKVVPFMISSDTHPFVYRKNVTCLAELACECTQSMGLTEMSVEGHDLTPQTQDQFHSMGVPCTTLAEYYTTCIRCKYVPTETFSKHY